MRNTFFALSFLLTGCTVGANLPFGGGFATSTSGPAVVETAQAAEADAPPPPPTRCNQELGQDTGGSQDSSALIDYNPVVGCFPKNDEVDGFIVQTTEGGGHTITVKALNDIDLTVYVYRINGKKILSESMQGHETLQERFEVPKGSSIYVKIEGHHYFGDKNGRYELTVQPERTVAAR